MPLINLVLWLSVRSIFVALVAFVAWSNIIVLMHQQHFTKWIIANQKFKARIFIYCQYSSRNFCGCMRATIRIHSAIESLSCSNVVTCALVLFPPECLALFYFHFFQQLFGKRTHWTTNVSRCFLLPKYTVICFEFSCTKAHLPCVIFLESEYVYYSVCALRLHAGCCTQVCLGACACVNG